jgi:hypothetical protein
MRSRARIVLSASVVALIVAGPGSAFAAWVIDAVGSVSSKAQIMPGGSMPAVSVSGRNVTVSWSASRFSGGTPVSGYTVRRYEGGSPSSPGSACSGTITVLRCTERDVPPGTYRYTVIPWHGLWSGAESALSASVTVNAPKLSLTVPTWLTSLPRTLSGSVSNFLAGETVTWRLDDPTGGPVLAGSTTPTTIPASGAATASVTIPDGVGDGPHVVYAVGTRGSVAGRSIAVDRTAPTIGVSALIKTQLGTADLVKQGGTYRVYAHVADGGSGMRNVRADISTVSSGQTSVSLSRGSWTVRGVTYNYRSGQWAANNPLAAGAKSFSVTATDVAGNVSGSTGSATVDNTPPVASDVQATNASGLTPGKADVGDTIALTYSEPIEPESIVSGWNGTTMTVTVRIQTHGAGDLVQVRNAGNSSGIPAGSIVLPSTAYVGATVWFSNSTMTMSGSTLVLVLGNPNLPGSIGTVAVPGTMRYAPTGSIYDRAANACGTAVVSEMGAPDVEF